MKRNLLKIPPAILESIQTFDQDDVVAATVKQITTENVADYEKLGLKFSEGGLVMPTRKPPNPSAGKYSHANVHGKEIKRKDLPKISKDIGHWAESWGSGSYHWVSNERMVYQKDLIPPKEVELSVELAKHQGAIYFVKFAIEQVINRRTPNFESELLYNLNLLQENVGSVGVYPSTTSFEEYAATVHVDWQLLPPGSAEEVLEKMLSGKRPVAETDQKEMRTRIKVLLKLRPVAFVTGSDGFLRYFGAKFGDNFVAFENVRYGNAIYIMFEDWQILSQKSRVELLAGPRDSFERIVHNDGWEENLSRRVEAYRKKTAH